MIIHQTIGVAKPVESTHNAGKNLQKGFPVGIRLKDVVPRIPTRGHMICRTGIFYPQGSGDDCLLDRPSGDTVIMNKLIFQNLTPIFRIFSTIKVCIYRMNHKKLLNSVLACGKEKSKSTVL